MQQSLDLPSDRPAILGIIAVAVLTALIICLWLAGHGAFAAGLWAQETH